MSPENETSPWQGPSRSGERFQQVKSNPAPASLHADRGRLEHRAELRTGCYMRKNGRTLREEDRIPSVRCACSCGARLEVGLRCRAGRRLPHLWGRETRTPVASCPACVAALRAIFAGVGLEKTRDQVDALLRRMES